MKALRVITPKKKAFFCISAVLFSGILMLGLNLALPSLAAIPLIKLIGNSFAEHEVVWTIFEMLMYLVILFLTGGFLLIVFRKNPFRVFGGTLSVPKFPFLFIPAAIGLMYLINIVIGIVFQEPFAPFETEVDAATFPGSVLGVSLYCISLSVLPAVFEEWLFRGIMVGNLAPLIGKFHAVTISAFVFGLMHLNPSQSIFAFAFGLVAGYAYIKTGSIWFGALIHMLNNAIAFVSSYWYYVYQVEIVDILLTVFVLLSIGIFVVSIPVYIVSAVQSKRKFARMSDAQRAIPTYGAILKQTVCNPLLYLLIASYCFALWFCYFYLG